MSRNSGVCPVPIDWKFKTSSRHERRIMIEEAYRNYEQREAEEWYGDLTLRQEDREPPPARGATDKRATGRKG